MNSSMTYLDLSLLVDNSNIEIPRLSNEANSGNVGDSASVDLIERPTKRIRETHGRKWDAGSQNTSDTQVGG